MRVHSETAWNIAILYSGVLASETRDLAAQIDAAIAAGRSEGLKEAANWLRRQANAEKGDGERAAFIEAHNAILGLSQSPGVGQPPST